MDVDPAFAERPSKGLRLLDWVFWLGLVGLVLFTISRHEPCADEAQSWLLARDSSWVRLIFFEMRYEGSPGLWQSILWVAIHLFHLPYAAFGYLGGAIALAGLAFIIICAPFPRILRYLVATSFYFAYQYAVVARPYELLPLLAFGSASLLNKGTRRVISLAVTLSLLAGTSLYGAMIAIAMAVAFAVRIRPQWSQLDRDQRKRVMAACAIFGLALSISTVIMFPPHTTIIGLSDARSIPLWMHFDKMVVVMFLAISNWMLAGIAVLSLVTLWLLERHGALLYLIAVGGSAFIFGFVRGNAHHQGIIIIALLTAVWAAWPAEAELSALPKNFSYLHWAMVTALSLLFAWQTYWSVVAIRNDWQGAYSGAKDMAKYLKSIHAETAGCGAYGYSFVAVQPYFDRNIFANLGDQSAPTHYRFSSEFDKSIAGIPAFVNRGKNPPCLLIAPRLDVNQDINEVLRFVEAQGYELVHTTEGWEFFRNDSMDGQPYWFFVRRPSESEFSNQTNAPH